MRIAELSAADARPRRWAHCSRKAEANELDSVKSGTVEALEFAGMERRRMQSADLFERDVMSVEIARRVGVSHQIVSDWRKAWRLEDARRYGAPVVQTANRSRVRSTRPS